MKRILFLMTFISVMSLISNANEQESIKQAVKKIAAELESKHTGGEVKIAILEFRTKENKLTGFNTFIQDELLLNYRNSKKFKVIDQNDINEMIKKFGWTNDKAKNFADCEEFTNFIFKHLGILPNAIIYGIIADNDETITITANFVRNSVKSTISAVEKFESNAYTDKLLGKKIREKKPDPKPVEPEIIIVPVVVEVEKEVIKEVIVEKEVVVDKPVIKTEPKQYSGLKGKIGNFEIEIISVIHNGDKITIEMTIKDSDYDSYVYSADSRFFDTDGNEFKSDMYQNTFRDRKTMKAIPLKGSITFREGNLGKVNSMQALEITLWKGYNDKIGSLRLHDVAVSK